MLQSHETKFQCFEIHKTKSYPYSFIIVSYSDFFYSVQTVQILKKYN